MDGMETTVQETRGFYCARSHASWMTTASSLCWTVMSVKNRHVLECGRGVLSVTKHQEQTLCGRHKGYYQAFWGILIDLIIELLTLMIKTFDNQTER